MMLDPMFLGVSTGRSGSVFTHTVFGKVGIPTQHERWFNAARNNPMRRWPHGSDFGEWSSQAVPTLMRYNCQVFHQVRHPLDVIGSYLGWGMWKDPEQFGPEAAFVASRTPEVLEFDDEVARIALFWIVWNERIEAYAGRRYWRWRIEDMNPDLLVAAAAVLGRSIPRHTARNALASTSKTTNRTPTKPPKRVTASYVRRRCGRELADWLTATADRYGYELA